MSDNPQPWFALPGASVVALGGRDALAFAQAQFMNDARPLADGQWQWSGWLTPKGRVVALFALIRRSGEEAWLMLPDAEPEAFAADLRRYVFRSKVAVASRPDLRVAGRFGPGAGGEDAVELELGAEAGARTLRISPAAAPEDAASVARWASLDLVHGIPRLPVSQAGQWTPQQLSLDRLHAYSVKKGCYPGQEIVARTHFLGQAKRGLVLLEGEGPLQAGAEVRSGDRAVGAVVSAAGNLALAVMPLEREGDIGLAVDGTAVRERAF